MEQQTKAFFPRLMGIIFIIIGIFLGIYAFFANATQWTLPYGYLWDNNHHLDQNFRNSGVGTGDIIQALYGSGGGSIPLSLTVYTAPWDGNQGNICFTGQGMSVVDVPNPASFPTALASNTIYVVDDPIINISSPVTVGNCSAVVSDLASGTVFTSPTQLSGIFDADNAQYLILDNISINGTGLSSPHAANTYGIFSNNNFTNSTINNVEIRGNIYGVYIHNNSTHDTLNDTKIHDNTYGIYFGPNSSNTTISNTNSYNNTLHGIYLESGSNAIISGSQSYNNGQDGIFLSNSFTDTINNSQTYNNIHNGMYLKNDQNITLSSILSYGNGGIGVFIEGSNNVGGSTIDTHANNGDGILLSGSNSNILTSIIADTSANAMGLRLINSSGNVFSGVHAYGNYYGGIHLFNSSYNTGTNIVSNSNEGGLYLKNSTNNNFTNIKISHSTDNGVVFISGSNNNILSGSIFSGNMGYGIYRQSSNNNSFSNSSVYSNMLGGIVMNTGNNNAFRNLNIYTNTGGGITINNSYNNIFDTLNIHNNIYYGITLSHGSSNIISGNIYSGNTNGGIILDSTIGNIITNSHDYGGGTSQYSLWIIGGSGNTVSLFSGIHDIGITIRSGNDNTDINNPGYNFDAYTISNNDFYLFANPYITLTGNIASPGTQFSPIFYGMNIQESAQHLIFSGTTLFTISGANRDGKLYAPVKITSGSKLGAIGETGMSTLTSILDTIEVVSGSTYLIMSGGIATINFYVLSGTSGQHLTLMKSINGNIRTVNTPDSGCTLDSSLLCTFRTNGNIKLFAFGSGTYANCSFAGYTLAGCNVSSGGYYTTGVYMYFTGDSVTGATLNGSGYTSGTLITGNGTYLFSVHDLANNYISTIFTIDTINPIVTGNYPTSGLNITGTSTITFTRSGSDTNISGYTLYIGNTGYTTTGTNMAINLSNGNFTWHVVAIDRAGNTGTSTTLPFTLTALLSGTGTTTGISYAGYTSSVFPIILSSNKPANFSITGDITGATLPPYSGIVNPNTIYNLTLTPGDGTKTIYITFSTGSETYNIIKSIILDTTAPSLPTLMSPISGATATGTFNLLRSPSSDAGVGLSGYQYFISTTGTFATVVESGFTINTGVTISNNDLGISGTFYRYIKPLDKLGNRGTSAIQSFYYSGIVDSIPDTFTFSSISNASLNKVYASNAVTFNGLSANTPVFASINRGALFISGNLVGTSGYIQNGWTGNIELISSNEYDTQVTSTLTVGGISAVFRITTASQADSNGDISTNLSSTQQLQIEAIFQALRDVYSDSKQSEFLDSLMVMLQSKIDSLGTSTDDINTRDALQYLYDLTQQFRSNGSTNTDINSASWIVNGVYTAPNGKKYTITYDPIKKFTSTSFITPKYYPTLDVLKYDIDRANPVGSNYLNAKTIKARRGKISIDGTRQTSAYTAPNHKVFYFFKTMDGQYSSYTFKTEKYFDSLEATKENIHNNNR